MSRPWLKRNNWVCFEHRYASRVEEFPSRLGERGSVRCPHDGAPLVNIGYRLRVPERSDDRGWEVLRRRVVEARNRYIDSAHAAHMRSIGRPDLAQDWWQVNEAQRLLKRWSRKG